jgi:hypothetical protein
MGSGESTLKLGVLENIDSRHSIEEEIRKMKRSCFWLVCAIALFYAATAPAELLVLFDEDDADEAAAGDFAALFISHDAGSTVEVTNDDAFSGQVSAFVTPSQSYNPNMTGWSFPIRENPGAGEYRYIQLAWKSDGGTGIMIQFPDSGAWGAVTIPCVDPPAVGTRRYIAGTNVTGWSGVCVSDDAPEDWTVLRRDLFEDFGEWTLTGMALTPFDDGGSGDYYDAIMIAADEDELGNLSPVEPVGKITTTWGRLKKIE